MSKSSNLIDVGAQFASSIAGRGCYLGLQVFLARRLGPESFGLYAVAWTVVGLVGTLAPIGMPQAVLRFGVTGRKVLHSSPLILATSLGLALSIVVWFSSGITARAVFGTAAAAPVIAAFAPSVVFFAIFQVLTSAMRGSQANVASAVVSAMMFALYFAACVVAFYLFGGPSAVTAGWMYSLTLLIASIPGALLLWKRPPSSAIPRMSTLTRFGLVTMLIHSASVLNLWADRIIVGVMSDAEAVGVYQVASQLAMVALVLRVAVISVFEARVPKVGASSEPPEITREFLSSTRILLHVTAPGLICLIVTSSFWTGTLFGKAYVAAAIPLSILVFGQLFQSFAGPSVTALHMTGAERYAAGLTIGTGLLNIFANVVLIPVFGLAGSAAASSIANVVLGVEGYLRLYTTGRLKPKIADLADIMMAVPLCGAISLAWRAYLDVDHLAAVIVLVLLNYLIYGAVVIRFCRVEDEILQLLFVAMHRFSGRRFPRRLPSS